MKDSSRFHEAKELFELFHGAGDGRIRVEMALHAEYTSTPKLVAQLAEYAKQIGAQVHIHVSETRSEHEECKARHEGRTPARYLSDLGLFDNKTTAAHCVWADEADMEIFAEKNVTVASCPVSNLKLASGVCPVTDLMKKGVAVAIGTDSVASNNSLNFFEEMKLFNLLQKQRTGDPTVLTPKETLDAATSAGAKCQGREDCGVIEVGARADLVVIDLVSPAMQPIHDICNNLVYSAQGRDVLLTMVDGRVVFRDGMYLTMDIQEVMYEANMAVVEIIRML
jgi:5-methylthioadenosine/S-adenosylhomocysteine deaminase